MTPELITAAVYLADTLVAENAALAAFDLGRAAAMLADKTGAADAFLAAQVAAARYKLSAADARPEVEALAARLTALAQENKRLLERAIAVQTRIIGTIARAAPRSRASPRYAAHGGMAPARPAPIALSARA